MNLSDDSYEPGPGWTLVWSDEFDSETLNLSKWRHQVVDAGRFNDEWQRYTDSGDNAYSSRTVEASGPPFGC